MSDATRPRIDWRAILLESFFVVLGVVLALVAAEWRQNVLEERAARTALLSIQEELRTNRQAVRRSLDYHLGLSDTLVRYARAAAPPAPAAPRGAALRSPPGAPPPGPPASVFSKGFIHPATTFTTAWEAAVATDVIRHMRYADVLRLSRAYEQQRDYRGQAESVGSVIYAGLLQNGFFSMVQNYRNMLAIIGTFWYRECQLLQTYDEVLAEMAGRDPTAARATDLPARCQASAGP